MTEQRAYCSLIAREAREPLAGTASHARGCVLVSYPKRLWGHDALTSDGLPEALALELALLRDAHDVITRFVAHEGAWEGLVDVTFFRERLRWRGVPLVDAAKLIGSARVGDYPEGAERLTRPLVLVCTHGQRDACCARFGLALVEALRAVDAPIEIHEASHLGGDRFAPTVLVLPSGHMFGHLLPDDAPALIEAVLGRAPLASRFRGSLWLPPLEQLAEAAAFGLPSFAGVTPHVDAITIEEIDATRVTLRATAWHEKKRVALEVRCARERRRVYGDCRNAEQGRTGGVDTWVIEDVKTP